MSQHIEIFIADEQGVTMVEYAIAGGLVGAGAIGAFSLLGFEVTRIITLVFDVLKTVTF
jgi:pilus assembly protein Flp/PilA